MLVLTRKKGQSIMIGDEIEVTIVENQNDQVRLGIKAPSNITVHRREIYLEIQEENKRASQVNANVIKELIKKK